MVLAGRLQERRPPGRDTQGQIPRPIGGVRPHPDVPAPQCRPDVQPGTATACRRRTSPPSRRSPQAVRRRCLCGAVRYELRGELRGILVCHCVECRRYHGTSGAYTSVARERPDAARIREDQLRWFPGPQSATGGERGFCGRCGSSLLWREPGQPDLLGRRRHARRGDRPAHRPAHLGRAAGRLGARRRPPPRPARRRRRDPLAARGVAEVHHAVAEAALGEQLERHAEAARQPRGPRRRRSARRAASTRRRAWPERRAASAAAHADVALAAFIRRTTSGSNSRSMRVLGVATASSVRGRHLVGARQIARTRASAPRRSPRRLPAAITSYIRA